MMPLLFARWVALRIVRHPGTWLALALLAATWPTVAALAPIGLATTHATEARALYEIAFAGCLAAAVATVAALRTGEPLLEPLGAGRRTAACLAAHGASALVFLVPTLLTAWAVGAPAAALRPGRIPLGALLTTCHLAALALCLDRLPLAEAMKVAALPSLAWVLPALLPDGPLGGALRDVLDAGRHLDFLAERPRSAAHRIASCLPILGLLLLARLLSRPALDALRRPR